jgi:hypothetical protein
MRPPHRLKLFSIISSVLIIGVLISSCSSTKKLDEVVFHEGPKFKLKLVRYYENIPLHYTGEVFRVLCSSEKTKNSPALKTQDAGWVTVGNGGAIGSKSAEELVARERDKYRIIDDQTLVRLGTGFNISFNSCGQFRAWYPTSLSEELYTQLDKPAHCKPKGGGDCRHYDFLGDRAPQFEGIQVKANGKVSFTVQSKAFKNDSGLHVESTDFGKTWMVKSSN